MKRHFLLQSLLLVLLFSCSLGDDEKNNSVTGGDSPAVPAYIGTWYKSAGGEEITLYLRETSYEEIFTEQESSAKYKGVYVVAGDQITFNTTHSDVDGNGYIQQIESKVRTWNIVGDTLTLTDSEGFNKVFTRIN